MATTKRTRKPKAEKTAKSTPVAKITAHAVDIREAVRTRAYELYEQRGCTDGRDFDDWLRAETEVLAKFGAA